MNNLTTLITRHTRAGATRDRALEAMSFLDFSGQPFGFRFKGIGRKQIQRVIAVYLKAEIISLVAPAVPGKLRAQYVVNPSFRKGAAESVTEVSKEDDDLFYSEWDGEDLEDELTEPSIQWDDEYEEEIRKADEGFSKAQAIGSDLAKDLKRGSKLYRAVTQLPLYLRHGDSTISEILYQTPFQDISRRTVEKALELIADAGHLVVEGSGRVQRKYSLVLEKQQVVAKKIVLASESQVRTAYRLWTSDLRLEAGPSIEQLRGWEGSRIHRFIRDLNDGKYDLTPAERRRAEARGNAERARKTSETRGREKMTREERRASRMTR